MKSYKTIQEERKIYHQTKNINTVHRSSLLVPEIEGSIAEISFLNHFLIKRGYKSVTCCISAIGRDGSRIEKKAYSIEEPRVYQFTLTGSTDRPAATYVVEFYSAENLFIPFPAVMVNHRGPAFLNQVHAYNRVLNDIFEDEGVNAHVTKEAAIDLFLRDGLDTFVLFAAGQNDIKSQLFVEVVTKESTHEAVVPLDLKKFGTQKVSIKSLFPELPAATVGILKVEQPYQPLFYGRMLVGRERAGHGFMANHSYYDSSPVAEYFSNHESSSKLFPFFQSLKNTVRMYPIMSPGTLTVTIGIHSRTGELLAEFNGGQLQSPGNRFLDLSIDDIVRELGFSRDEVSSFAFTASTRDEVGIPSRTNLQLVYGTGATDTSINTSLYQDADFRPEGKKGFRWGQTVVGGGYNTQLGIVSRRGHEPKEKLDIAFYSTEGRIAERTYEVSYGRSVVIDLVQTLAGELTGIAETGSAYIWYTISSQNPVIFAYQVTVHSESGYCSGEHAF